MQMHDETKKLRARLAHEVQVGCLHHRFKDVGEILLALVDHIGAQDERIAELSADVEKLRAPTMGSCRVRGSVTQKEGAE